jgi:hypothetical protein
LFESDRQELTMQNGVEYSGIVLYFTNVGIGAATRFSAEYRIPVLNETGKKELGFIFPQSEKQWTIPVAQPKRGDTLEIHLKYNYRDILNESYSEEDVFTIPQKLF